MNVSYNYRFVVPGESVPAMSIIKTAGDVILLVITCSMVD